MDKNKNRLQLVYVLTSTEKDIYLEQAYVSMYSARKQMPDVQIILVVDKLTEQTLSGVRAQEAALADRIVSIDTPQDLNGQRRSRLLKTSVRKYIKGDFLFIDCDTMVVKPLDEVLNVEADIAACYDSHCVHFKENPYYKGNVAMGCRIGMPEVADEAHYFNSGVILVRDTDLAHRFYERWHENLLKGVEKKVFMDQPSFAQTDFEMGHVLKVLPDVWNVELKHGVRFLKDAKIVHYLCTNRSKNKQRQFFIMNDMEVLMAIKHDGVIPQEVLDTIEDPFLGLSPITHCFAGEDIYFFKTQTFQWARNMYDSRMFPCVEWSFGKYYGLRKRMSALKKRLTNINGGGV